MNKLSDIEQAADEWYQMAAADLPREGNYHFASAVGFVADSLYDQFHLLYPKMNFSAVATRVVRRYADNDTAISKKRERQNDEKRARLSKLAPISKVKVAELSPHYQPTPAPKQLAWDRLPVRRKRLGHGSY